MKTTIKELYEKKPCRESSVKFLNNIFDLNLSENDNIVKQFNSLTEEQKNKEITILDILNSNGVKDAYWALKTQDYKDYCLILADVAESVLYIFETNYPDDNRPHQAIKNIRMYKDDQISLRELQAAAVAAVAASAAASSAFSSSSFSSSFAAAASADSTASFSSSFAAAASAAASAASAADSTTSTEQWTKNEQIMRKYLEEVKK